MIKHIAFLITLLGICESTWANTEAFDYRYEVFTRSNPIGAYARAEAGYSIPFWGKPDPAKPLYGLIRPMAQFQTSGLINSVHTRLEFYPISFLAFYVGQTYMRRDINKLDTLDCDGPITCKSSNIQRKVWGLKLAFAFKNTFLLTRARWHTTTIKNKESSSFFDEQGTLIGSGSRDTLFQSTTVLGQQLNKTQGIALLHKRNLMKNTRQDSSMTTLFYRHLVKGPKRESTSYMVGPGLFHTRQGTNHPTLVAVIQWNPKPGFTLF